jgi:hypothetical protein
LAGAWIALAALIVVLSCSTTPGNDGSGRGTGSCSSGLAACGAGVCANIEADPGHCGGCGMSCEVGQECRAGGCQCIAALAACASGCTNTQSDPDNCGQCGNACPAELFCNRGVCSASCDADLAACGRACVDTAADVMNCGMCGASCGAGQTCAASSCTCIAAGQSVCGGQCTDVLANDSHCGTCGLACTLGQTCAAGACSGAGVGGAGNTGAGGAGGGSTGSGSGLLVGSMCFPVCASGASTDEDSDGYGFEGGRSCVVAGHPLVAGASACEPPPPEDSGIPPGDGFYIDGTCVPPCASNATDPDENGATDGWGYEGGRSCIVVGSPPALGAVPCIPDTATAGDGYLVDGVCVSACAYPELADMQGYGYEAQRTCVVDDSPASVQNARCAVEPRTDLPPPGDGFRNGQTCFPPCSASAADVTAEGYGWDVNRTCIVPDSTAAIQSVPCVPPPSTVTGECPRELACPSVDGTPINCGCTWIEGLAERKEQIMGTSGASRYFLASAMMETETLLADYTLGDGKVSDAFNAGLCKQNWGMIRRCHPAWSGQDPDQYMTSVAMNSDLALDIQVYNECRSMFGDNWWSGHRAGYNNLGSTVLDIRQFKAAMDWTDMMLDGHLADDVRFWVDIRPI